MKIGIFGGTFDPIHKGHLALARAAQEEYALEKVLFVPARIPPHKKNRTDLAPAADRLRMVELAIANEPGFEVSRAEVDREGPSYTIDTLYGLAQTVPQTLWYLILGADSLEGLPHWRAYEEICRRAHLLVAKRPGASTEAPACARVSWLEMPEYPVASSEIRSQIGTPVFPAGELPVEVASYIKKNNLYTDRF